MACSLSELQPSPKWNGFKLRTFDSDSVSTLSSCGPAGPLSDLEGHADPRQPWFWGKFSVCYESLLDCSQNKRWDHVWVGRLLKPLSDGEGSCWIKGCFVDLWCNTDWQNGPFFSESGASDSLYASLICFLLPRHIFSFSFLPLSVLLVVFHKDKNTLGLHATFHLLISSSFLSVSEIKSELRVSPLINWLRLKMIFPPSAPPSFLGTFQSTFSCLAIRCLVYRAAKPWRHHRLWLTLWTRQSLVQGSVYKQCCTMCPLWPRSHLSFWCASWDHFFYVCHLLNLCSKSPLAVFS